MVGDIKLFAGDFTPQGWLPCNGGVLSIAQYRGLFAVVGTKYGGNGVTDFALPDLAGVPNSGEPAVTNYLIAIQ